MQSASAKSFERTPATSQGGCAQSDSSAAHTAYVRGPDQSAVRERTLDSTGLRRAASIADLLESVR